MNKIIAISYADTNYRDSLRLNAISLKIIGNVDEVILYGPHDIDEHFYNENEMILKEKKGAGYYLWKPYIINKTMMMIEEGEYLLYIDAAILCIKNIRPIIKYMESTRKSILCFETPFLEENWTKDIVRKLHAYDNEFQIEAAYMFFKVTRETREIVKSWLDYSCIKKYIDDTGVFYPCIEHRYDQAIFSLVCRNNKIEPVCSISNRYFYYAIVKLYDHFYINRNANYYANKYYKSHINDNLGWIFFCHHLRESGIRLYLKIIKQFAMVMIMYIKTPKKYRKSRGLYNRKKSKFAAMREK